VAASGVGSGWVGGWLSELLVCAATSVLAVGDSVGGCACSWVAWLQPLPRVGSERRWVGQRATAPCWHWSVRRRACCFCAQPTSSWWQVVDGGRVAVMICSASFAHTNGVGAHTLPCVPHQVSTARRVRRGAVSLLGPVLCCWRRRVGESSRRSSSPLFPQRADVNRCLHTIACGSKHSQRITFCYPHTVRVLVGLSRHISSRDRTGHIHAFHLFAFRRARIASPQLAPEDEGQIQRWASLLTTYAAEFRHVARRWVSCDHLIT
jgi:hypothetical protein